MIRTPLCIGLLAACSFGAAAQDAQHWDFSTDPFAVGGGWTRNHKPPQWTDTNVTWDEANQQVQLKVVDGTGGGMNTPLNVGPGVFDFKAKIITTPGIASCFWTYLDHPYYSEIDLEITAAPSHRNFSDGPAGTLVNAGDVCPDYTAAESGDPSTNVVRFTSYNNKNTSDRYTTVWQNVKRPGIDLTDDILRTYRFAWYATGDIHTDRIEYWIGDGAVNGETMTLVFALYADKVRFYDNRIKTNTGDVANDYHMERRSHNSGSDYTPETIDGQERMPGKAYSWNGNSYDESDATEFLNYDGTMKPCIPGPDFRAQIWIAPWCPDWSRSGSAPPTGTHTMLLDSVTYTPTSATIDCDVNGDGITDAQDLDAVRACLGICDSDVDASGRVDVLDLLQVIDDWGECSPAP